MRCSILHLMMTFTLSSHFKRLIPITLLIHTYIQAASHVPGHAFQLRFSSNIRIKDCVISLTLTMAYRQAGVFQKLLLSVNNEFFWSYNLQLSSTSVPTVAYDSCFRFNVFCFLSAPCSQSDPQNCYFLDGFCLCLHMMCKCCLMPEHQQFWTELNWNTQTSTQAESQITPHKLLSCIHMILCIKT